jgi:DNA-binding transcriptional LysR family regulator
LNVNSNRYEIFLKVVEHGNITRAAEALNYTQSGVSHAIAALEKETGFALFRRSSNGVTLTDNGKHILERVQSLVNQQRSLAQTIANINNVVAGTIRVGTFTSVSAQWLPGIIRSFQELYPLVDFELLDGNYDEITEWITQGKIDCGFLTAPVPEVLHFRPLKQDPLMVILEHGHPLTEKETLSLDDIIKEPFIMPMKGSDNDIQAVLRNAASPPKIKYTLNDDISVMAMVANGFGISIMPELIIRNVTFPMATRSINPPQYRNIGIVSLPVSAVTIVARAFLRYLSDTDVLQLESPLSNMK